MKKIIAHIIFLLLCSMASKMNAQCTNYTITVSLGFWPSEVSWQFVDAANTVVASGLAGANQVVCLPDGCYTFRMIDSYGDGWNGAAFTITAPGPVTIATGTFTTGFLATQAVTLGNVNCCPAGTTSYLMNVTSGAFSAEVSWYIRNGAGTTVASGGAPYNSSFCLPPGCYELYLFDSFGDGWDGAVYTISNGATVLATGTLDDGDSEINLVGIGGVSCLPTCSAGMVPYLLTVSAGSFPNEISWSLFNQSGTLLDNGGAPSAGYFCASTNCYSIVLNDSFGDGWNGAEFILYDEFGNQTQTGTLNSGSSVTIPLEIGTADCGIVDPVTASDCIFAVDICENFAFAIDPNGQGLINEIPPLGSLGNPDYMIDGTNSPWGTDHYGCLRANELNSTWMIINIWQGGMLNFTFGGMGTQSGFYDWIMYPYDEDNACQDIYNNVLPPVRCNWNFSSTGGTGLQTTLPAGGVAGNYEPPLLVNTGDQYIICFSNYSSSTTTVPLDFGGTAIVGCSQLVLPVELISFTALEKNNCAELQWSTMSESNNDFFEVQHQDELGNWKTIGVVDGMGTTQNISNYSFLHRMPHSGLNYYRLKQVDFNGAFAYSETVAVHIGAGNNFISPNPNNGKFVVNAPLEYLKILNACGAEVPFHSNNTQEVSLIHPAKGIYIVHNEYTGESWRMVVE
jgi:hypothetical protein